MNPMILSRAFAATEGVTPQNIEVFQDTSRVSECEHSSMAAGWTIAETSPLHAELGWNTGSAMARVSAISPERVALELVSGQTPPTQALMSLRLQTATRETSLEVDRVWQLQPGSFVARIAPPVRALARELSGIIDDLVGTGQASLPLRQPLVDEVIDDASRQREVVESMLRNGFEGTLRVAGFPVGPARLVRVTEEGVVFELPDSAPAGPCSVDLVGYNCLYSIEFADLHPLEGGFGGTPERVRHLRHRTFRRVAPPPTTHVEFVHPRWPDVRVRRPVREISAQGLSFLTSLQEDLMYPGLQVAEATLIIGGQALRFSGEVKALVRDTSGEQYYCGFRLYPATASDEDRWLSVLDECLHASTRIGGDWARPTWKLFERAGYFALSGKDPAAFERLFRSFEDVSAKIAAAPRIGCQAVWPHDAEEVEGAMSMVKVYSSSWLVYQLAKVTGPTRRNVPSRKVLRDLHLRCYEHAQRDRDLRWLVGIPQATQTWSRSAHYDLPRRYITSGQAAIVRFRAVEVPCESQRGAWPEALEVGDATSAEIEWLVAQIAATRSPVYADALDLTPERFGLSQIEAAWSESGFRRRRTVHVARAAGRPVAAAVLESADDGLHLFRLLDSVRLYPLATGGERAFGPLLTSAGAWYAARQKRSFVAFLEDDWALPAGSPAGSTDLGLADFVILSASHLPELLEHVYQITAPRSAPLTRGPAAPERRLPSEQST